MKNMGFFYLKIFRFLEVNFFIYLNRHVFIMYAPVSTGQSPVLTGQNLHNLFYIHFKRVFVCVEVLQPSQPMRLM